MPRPSTPLSAAVITISFEASHLVLPGQLKRAIGSQGRRAMIDIAYDGNTRRTLAAKPPVPALSAPNVV